MDEKTNGNDNITISKEAFGILAFLLGALGIHDFVARRFLYGCGHLALFITAILIFRISQSSFLPPTLIIGSWVWAIVENNAYQKSVINMVSQNEETEKKMDARGFLSFARTAEVFTFLAIASNIVTIIMFMKSRNMVCHDTSCGWSKGLMIVLPVIIDFFTTALSIIFIGCTLARRKELSVEQKHAKDVSRHIKTISILGIFLIITLIIAAIVALRG